MRIRIFDSSEECRTAAAWRAVGYMLKEPCGAIGLCTGSTTGPIHEMIAEIYRKNPFDASGIHTVNADEFLTPQAEGYDGPIITMRPGMEKTLWSVLGIDENHAHMPDANPKDWEAEAEKYETTIREIGGIGLQMLGVGPDAHLGFCLPETPFGTISHVAPISQVLTESSIVGGTRQVNPKWGPFYGITMGLRTFMQGRELLPITVGASKAEAVEKAILGPVTEEVPASILQLHPNCTWYMDREAAAGIIGRIDENGVRIK